MNEFAIANVVTMQRRRYCAIIPMNVYSIMNVLMVQRRIFYANVTMDVFYNIHALIAQRRRCCSFDSPGLARNEPTPGEYSQGDSTPSVLSFFYEGMVIARAFIADYA